jgi:hypothetical protein
LQRYFYLRTGILADLLRSDSAPAGYCNFFILGNKNRKQFHHLADSADIRRYSENLKDDGFFIKSYTTPRGRLHVIAGGNGTDNSWISGSIYFDGEWRNRPKNQI